MSAQPENVFFASLGLVVVSGIIAAAFIEVNNQNNEHDYRVACVEAGYVFYIGDEDTCRKPKPSRAE